MFGAFRPSNVSMGGLLWKVPYRLSTPRKFRVRSRLTAVDEVISTIKASGVECSALARALMLPTEKEMPARDKYTTFTQRKGLKGGNFRKGVHKVPKWTRLTLRENPKGF